VNNIAIACVLHAERVILQLHSKTMEGIPLRY